MWNGEFFQRMSVYVDLAPAVESEDKLFTPPPLGVKPRKALLIPKKSRHGEVLVHVRYDPDFHDSYSSTEQAVIAALSPNVKHGLTLSSTRRLRLESNLERLSSSRKHPDTMKQTTIHTGLKNITLMKHPRQNCMNLTRALNKQ